MLEGLHSSPDILRVRKWRSTKRNGHVARMGEDNNEYVILVGKPEGKRAFGRPMHKL